MIKLSNQFEELRNEFTDSIKNGADKETQAQAYQNMINQLHEDAVKSAQGAVDGLLATTPAEAKMTARERAFFNEVADPSAPKDVEKVIPEETVDRIFEDLTQNRPLLAELGIKNAGLRLKIYTAETEGHAVWGNLFDEIEGQLKQGFNESTEIQNKLTAFVILPKDLNDFGPAWIMNLVTTQITEAFASALEAGFLNGDGDNKPVGLSRSLTGKVTGGKTTYTAKKAQGTLTFADSQTVVNELKDVNKFHATKEKNDADGNPIPVETDGNIVMVVNPADAWDLKAQYTSLNANGVYVTAMPFNIKIVESVHQEAGKVTTFVRGRYDAYVASQMTITKYDQTLAQADRDLYTAKQFAYGKARDEKAAAVWNLNITAVEASPGA